MLEDTPGDQPTTTTAEPAESTAGETPAAPPAKKTATKRAPAKKTSTRKTAAKRAPAKKTAAPAPAPEADAASVDEAATEQKPARKTTSRRTATKPAEAAGDTGDTGDTGGPTVLFQPPDPTKATRKPRTAKATPATDDTDAPVRTAETAAESESGTEEQDSDSTTDETGGRRRRRRGGRRRRKPGTEGGGADGDAGSDDDAPSSSDDGASSAKGSKTSKDSKKDSSEDSTEDAAAAEGKDAGEGSSRRRRRRRRSGDEGGETTDDKQSAKSRSSRSAEDQITSVSGSTRLEAKKQRRREGREAGRRRAPIVSEAEFLARRESVDRVMAIRQHDDLTQIAVLEDKVLVEHYVARESQTSLIGNVYLGRVQNVLPSMEAAFIDIGKGRNAVLYAGEVNWSALGHKEGQPRKIESVLSSGQTVLVQVTKDPLGHKGARLTSQISLAGRFLVYVPDGTNSGISRKLPDTERNRLKSLLKEIVPEGAGVIVRTAAEGASEEELTRDVERLTARWDDIEKGVKKSSAPKLLYGEPDLTLKVVRDLFTEDFSRLVIQGDEAWETVHGYVSHVAPDLESRVERHEDGDLFATHRIDEQISKGLDRKVYLPSGGSLVIDRTEAMTVVDVNTGKFTGSGGNLEETVTKNNLEAAEEIVRQLRLRDIGGIIVIDFIDMVLESNRDLVLRRLVECLGRDRTRHQVAEVTSLGLVQMTRKRIGTGLLEAFSEPCSHCSGRGVLVRDVPVEPSRAEEEPRRSRKSRSSRGGKNGEAGSAPAKESVTKPRPSPKDVAAMARPPEPAPDDAESSRDEAAPEPDDTTVPTEAQPEAPAAERGRASEDPASDEELVPELADQAVDETPAAEATAAAPAAAPAAEPAASPAVVTRSRRRSARRPAGPPASVAAGGGAGAVGSPPTQGSVEPAAAGPPAPVVEHVPVKKRGSRKR